ncbi:MAG TPA: regulatory iron-sulfur-containing complex subunit RicT [Saprospiraceae bacterium]|nr:regulatory iron-sulfur-containing complex subunit RicT [Saprospiraceae bacterium]HMP24257.1 regulatory iron-sulfur-containing complex subunit RicT [Saprospiraceae bacterium]
MACAGCSVSKNGKPGGCSGGCASGGCNRLNTYDWLTDMEIEDAEPFDIVEISFKNGSRKAFYRKHEYLPTVTGDWVAVETGTGYDLGVISLSGDLVRLQMKKKRVNEDAVLYSILRKANERDLERLQEARDMERETMIRARAITRTLGLDMKIGDVEYQGDGRKATFYYTADGRVDFRELIRHFAREFRVKIEMRQIGARQESARIGGIGSCGRELCCSTWLTDFKSVSTAAARYQNLAINQAKLSGQCGRLKCCLNYELDTYLDALDHFPERAEKLFTQSGTAVLIKTDIFKGLMFYAFDHEHGRGKIYTLNLEQVKAIKTLNDQSEKPFNLGDGLPVQKPEMDADDENAEMDFEDVTGAIELPDEKRKKRRKKKRGGNKGDSGSRRTSSDTQPKAEAPARQQPRVPQAPKTNQPPDAKAPQGGQAPKKSRRNKNRRNKDNRKKE